MARKPRRRLTLTRLETRDVPAVALLADLKAEPAVESQTANDLTRPTLGGFVYFVGTDSTHGRELWRSDGTAAGTTLVHDLSPGGDSTDIRKIVVSRDRVVFAADKAGDGITGPRLYAHDPATGTTALLVDDYAFPADDPSVTLSTVDSLTPYADGVLWGGYAQIDGGGLRRTAYRTKMTDPDHVTTVSLERFDTPLNDATDFVALDGRSVFLADPAKVGASRGLYGANSAGSAVLLAADNVFFSFQKLAALSSGLAVALRPTDSFFSDYELVVTDGSVPGTRTLATPAGVKLLGELTVAGGKAYFTARESATSPDRLYVTDGTAVTLLGEFNPELNDSKLRLPKTDGDILYFPASDGVHGIELWSSTGTPRGTSMVADLAPGADGSVGHYLNTAAPTIPQVGGIAYFLASPGGAASTQPRLYRTDRFTAGTFPVEDGLTVATLAAASEFYVGPAGGKVLFQGGPVGNPKLWAADPAAPAVPTSLTLTAVTRAFDSGGGASHRLTATVTSSTGNPVGRVRFEHPDGTVQTGFVVNGQAGASFTLAEADLRSLLAGNLPTFRATFEPEGSSLFLGSDATATTTLDLSRVIQVGNPTSTPNPVVAGARVDIESALRLLIGGVPADALNALKVRFDLAGPSYTGPLDTVPVANLKAAYGGSTALLAPGAYTVRAVLLAADGKLVLGESADAPLTLAAPPAAGTTTTTLKVEVTALSQSGGSARVTATVTSASGTPTGEVRFNLGSRQTDKTYVRDDGTAVVFAAVDLNRLGQLFSGGDVLAADFVPAAGSAFLPSQATLTQFSLPAGSLLIATPNLPATARAGDRIRLATALTFLVPDTPQIVFLVDGLTVRFEATGPGGPRTLGKFVVKNGGAEVWYDVSLPAGRYEVRAVVEAGDAAILGRSNPAVLTVGGSQLSAPLAGDPGVVLTSAGTRYTLSSYTAGGGAVSRATASQAISDAVTRLQSTLGGTVTVQASADFNADGVLDLVSGTSGTANAVVVTDGKTGDTLKTLNPFERTFTGGMSVTVADANGDGTPDVVVSPNVGGGPRVVVFDGSTFGTLIDFFGIDDPNFRGGARTAISTLGGVPALMVAAGIGGGPRVVGYSLPELLAGRVSRLVQDFFAFEPSLRNGAYVAAGDVTGDGVADLVLGGGPGGGPRVLVLDGAELRSGNQKQVASFFAGDPNSRLGVKVKVIDRDGDGTADILAAPVGEPKAAVYSGKTLGEGGTPPADDLGAFNGAVEVG